MKKSLLPLAGIFVLLINGCSCALKATDINPELIFSMLPFTDKYAFVYSTGNNDLQFKTKEDNYEAYDIYKTYMSNRFDSNYSYTDTSTNFVIDKNVYNVKHVQKYEDHEVQDDRYFINYFNYQDKSINELLTITYDELIHKCNMPEDRQFVFGFKEGYLNFDQIDFLITAYEANAFDEANYYMEMVFNKATKELIFFEQVDSPKYSEDEVCLLKTGSLIIDTKNSKNPELLIGDNTIILDDAYLYDNSDYYKDLRESVYTNYLSLKKRLIRFDRKILLSVSGGGQSLVPVADNEYGPSFFEFHIDTCKLNYLGFLDPYCGLKGLIEL